MRTIKSLAESFKLGVTDRIRSAKSYLLLFTLFLLLSAGCAMKSARKNMTVLSLGDSKGKALEFWGEPDVIKKSSGPWGKVSIGCTNASGSRIATTPTASSVPRVITSIL